jgi:hypothetical protein
MFGNVVAYALLKYIPQVGSKLVVDRGAELAIDLMQFVQTPECWNSVDDFVSKGASVPMAAFLAVQSKTRNVGALTKAAAFIEENFSIEIHDQKTGAIADLVTLED